jgi:hypothetical protein
VLAFIKSSTELQPNRITNDEVKDKSSIELRLTEPLLIGNKKMSSYLSASIAANPMLYAAVSLLSALTYC